MKKRIVNWTIIIMMFALTASTVFAAYLNQPTPPNEEFSILSVSRRGYVPSKYIQAEAGNVSELRMNVSSVTRGWQGYYGNISGVIVLDDSLNNTMYSWELADPEGEIYAARNSSINWNESNIICANITHVETEETRLNFNLGTGQDIDGINETFSYATHPSFVVGNNSFASDECNFTVTTYVDDGPPAAGSRTFNETLLWSTAEGGIIYMAYIFIGSSDGFKTGTDNYDFQMLVGEDGHAGDTTPVNYYFWVEIE